MEMDKKASVGCYEEGKCENVLRSVSTSLKSLYRTYQERGCFCFQTANW